MQSNLSKSSRAAVKELKVDWSIIYILESSLTRLKNYRAARKLLAVVFLLHPFDC